jgi:3-hydroxyacyl-CoA dehydrogenase
MMDAQSSVGTAVVIGAGTMGGGIAAQLANAGWQVRLLDVAGPESSDNRIRNQAALAGLERVQKNRPPLLALPEYSARIQTGNMADHLAWLRDADWILEAVAEKREIKQAVMAQMEAWAGPDAVLSTNTSGLSLRQITAERGADFKRRFLGTHFFNPPRYLTLVELIRLPETDPAIAAGFTGFAERILGCRVVAARDTPGFISNRIGMWHLLDSLHTAEEQDLTVEEVDYLTGSLIGRPRSGTFRLADLIGFDIMADIARNQYEALPQDPFRERLLLPSVLQRSIAAGRRGQKSGAGFYKREGSAILALDPTTLDYRPQQTIRIEAVEALLKLPLPERLTALKQQRGDRWDLFLNTILTSLTKYAEYVAPEIADDALAIDRVMMWGFNWEMGPLAIRDLLSGPAESGPRYYGGAGVGKSMRVFSVPDLQPLPEEPEYLSLSALKEAGKTIRDSAEASLIDLGDGVACVEFHTKMNTLNPALIAFLDQSREIAERDFRALVLGNQGKHWSAGYDLKLFLDAMAREDWKEIDRQLHDLQSVFLRLKYSKIPIVAAPHGYTLGGGCECTLHCTAVVAASELWMGLPETSVGVLPAGGGTTQLLARATQEAGANQDLFPSIERVFDLLMAPRTSTSAHEARKIGLMRSSDLITMNAGRLLFEAKQHALSLANSGYRPFVKQSIRVMGEETLARLRMKLHGLHRSGAISDHDRLIADRVAYVLSGGNLPGPMEIREEILHHLEREVFIALAREPKSAERMRHVLETGKPLKN